ncbi:MAG: hypothetical protein AAF430_20135 [Myxococcota bacterium]
MQQSRSHAARVLFAVVSLAGIFGASGCAKPPDPDAQPAGSRPLSLNQWQRDGLHCGRGGDCVDWYRFDTPTAGKLRVDVAKLQDDGETPVFSVVVGDASGAVLFEEENQGRTRLLLRHPERGYAAKGRYTLAVKTPETGSARFDYEIRVQLEPKPVVRKQAPRFRKVRASLLEIETLPDGREAVLLDKGKAAGLARGQRGRLLQGGRKIADIEVIDVYRDGSRAAIRGSSSGVNASTVAEVDVPR